MKTRKKNKENAMRISITILSICMLLGCTLYIGYNVCCRNILVINSEPEELSVYCKNDEELLLSWTTGYKRTQHEFCPVCGEKTEDVGIIASENCLKCIAKIGEKSKYCSSCGSKVEKIYFKDWIKEKGFSSFDEYDKDYANKKDVRTTEIILAAFSWIIPICLIIFSREISETICRKRKQAK